MSLEIQTDLDLPDPMKDPEFWIQNSLNDLFFLCTNVLSHGKQEEYRDLNWIHMALCDFVDINNPWLQMLILMARDMLKSSIMRADIIQWFMRKSYHDRFGKIGLYCGVYDLAQESLDKIMQEIYTNELLQTFFYKYLPSKKNDCRIAKEEKVRYKKIEIDIGSPKRPLTGRHFEGIHNDNLCNEVNTQTLDLRNMIIRRWQQQESLLAENAWEKLWETPWEKDDVSGRILDPDGRFDYEKLHRKPAYVFTATTGYKVFSCPARGPDGAPAFPEKLDEVYLERKRRKQGPYVYSRMYDLQPVSDEDQILKREWLIHYSELPDNYIRNMVIDCSGTTKKESTHSAISIADWDERGTMHLAFAERWKLTPMELYRKAKELIEKSEEEDKRLITFIGIEKEKFGIFLSAIFDMWDPDLLIWEIDIRGRPRHKRLGATVPYYEQGLIQSKKGLKNYEDEYNEYYKDKDVDVGILDTVAYHLDIKMTPVKTAKVENYVPPPDDETREQFRREREAAGGLKRKQINQMF